MLYSFELRKRKSTDIATSGTLNLNVAKYIDIYRIEMVGTVLYPTLRLEVSDF